MMKTALQLAASAIGVAGLLVSVASQATDLSELPLKASVLAKPNVIWGMDDSGSMDWEALLNTSSGVVWWNGSSAWDSTNQRPLSYSASYYPYEYLFPVGTATGGQIYAYNSVNGLVLPPTTQFAWLRSAKFNSLYYDTSVTYSAWAPAYLSGTTTTSYPNATTTAAKSHPATSSSTTLDVANAWSSSSTNFLTNGYTFFFQNGMKIPSGSVVTLTGASSGPCSATGTLTSDKTVTAGYCWVAVPYFPATFWYPETCTADNTSLTSNCVTGPDGTTTLKRYEIKSTVTSYPSGRTYADELQNFANWFTYYRKRKLMLAGSMGQVLENITGLRMGVVPFNNRTTITMNDADSTDITKNRLAVLGKFYLNGLTANGTPTLSTIKHIGTQLESDTNIIKYACQKNSAFVVTDGFANDYPQTSPSYQSGLSSSTYGSGSPYATTSANTQSDLALVYYTNRLRASGSSPLAAGLVPISTSTAASADKNPNLHMNFYAISLGARGSQYSPGRDAYSDPPTWVTPANDDPTMLDDLWHATVNGRGKMYLATTPTETAKSIDAGLRDILDSVGAQSGIAVSSVNLSRGDGYAYMARYNPWRWSGDLTANAINPTTAVISTTSTWSAATLLAARDWTTRQIASTNGSGGVGFTATGVGSLVNPSSTWGDTALVMNYLRGDRTNEGSLFRNRASLMGAVINAEPVISRNDNVVYVASGEGMLHAFDTAQTSNRGQELWAYVPYNVLPDIGQTTDRAYSFKTQLDGTPALGTYSGGKLLVAGLGAAGRQYYALDVTTPRTNTEANAASWVKWTFPAAGDTATQAKVGQTVGRPLIVNTAAGYRVVVTSGYNSTADGKGRLFVLDPSSGAVLKEFITPDGTLSSESGVAQVAGYQEADGTVRYVFGGDLLGNVWRFDLDAATGTAPDKMAILKGPTGALQSVTAAPALAEVAGRRVVLVGTGRLLDVTDWGNSLVQTVYAIAEGSTLSSVRTSLVQQTYTGHSTDTITTTAVNWTTGRGWYMDLPAGEHANTRPSIDYDKVAFTTNVAGASDCTASSYYYIVDIGTGGAPANATFVSTQISSKYNASEVTVVAVQPPSSTCTVDCDPPPGCTKGDPRCDCPAGTDRVLVQTTAGTTELRCGSTPASVAPSKNSWREIFRQ